MRNTILIIGIYFFIAPLFSQTIINNGKIVQYTKLEPLIKKINGQKIKMVMADYKHNKVLVITQKNTFAFTKRQASDNGIIPPLPEIKQFQISSVLYRNVINIIDLADFDRKKERIGSDEGVIYFDENTAQLKVEIYIPDSITLYKINIETNDTLGVCKKEILKLPDNESINPEIGFGNIYGKLVTKELLKEQKEIKVPPGYELINTTVYFAGPGFRNVMVHSLQNKDLSPLRVLLDSCRNESAVILDNVIIKTPSGRLIRSKIPTIKVGIVAKPFDYSIPVIQFGIITQSRAEHNIFIRQKKFMCQMSINSLVH